MLVNSFGSADPAENRFRIYLLLGVFEVLLKDEVTLTNFAKLFLSIKFQLWVYLMQLHTWIQALNCWVEKTCISQIFQPKNSQLISHFFRLLRYYLWLSLFFLCFLLLINNNLGLSSFLFLFLFFLRFRGFFSDLFGHLHDLLMCLNYFLLFNWLLRPLDKLLNRRFAIEAVQYWFIYFIEEAMLGSIEVLKWTFIILRTTSNFSTMKTYV